MSREQALLECVLRGETWPRAWIEELIAADSGGLISVVAEGLSDRFEGRLVEAYTKIFAEVIAAVVPEYRAGDLVQRYRRVRCGRSLAGEPSTVFVLSRVTLGAEVAISSVVLDAVLRRFPEARIVLVGPEKCWELFAGNPRVEHLAVSYGRSGGLRERVATGLRLDEPRSIVVDPDSRITQLGLLPVCAEENYYLFESRSYGGEGTESLGELTRRWTAETFGMADARAWIDPVERPALPEGGIAVSLGVGGNAAKRVPDPFETELLRALARRGLPLVVDAGAGGEEAERVEKAIAKSGAGAVVWRGSFAGFASVIARSRLYVGYDSAGQHVAAACGVRGVTVFAGAPCERFEQRWRPFGRGAVEVVRAEGGDLVGRVMRAVGALG